MSAHRHRAYRWPAIAVGTVLLLAGEPALAQPSPAARRGMMFVRMHCAQCHAVDRVSPSPLAGAPPLRDLKLKYPVSDLQRPLATGIHPGMPLIRLQPHQVEDIMEYLKMFER
jgi:mono/diheme cytochrome c family protein